MSKINLKVKIGKLELKNPIMVASGTFGYGEEFHNNFYDISRLGAVVTKGISLLPRKGNATPRIYETASGMLNAIGLQNVGLEAFIDEKLPFLKKVKATTIVNILGQKVEEYVELAQTLDKLDGVHAIELNISCPNVKSGGVQFGTDPKLAARVTSACKKKMRKPLIVKLSPNFHDMPLMAEKVKDAGADSLSIMNTITGMAICAEKRRPVLANVIGGLSGPAIKPIALRMVWQVSRSSEGKRKKGKGKSSVVPIIGIGGIMNVTDVVEFLLAGSTAVQIGTANFVNPMVAFELVGQLEKYLDEHNISDVKELIGGLMV